ncbi:ABC transporter substrate-binding protein [Aliarcobacter butzleri]|uniref:histidine kinase n=1 Tax=Aliarcobacter butzleri L351 TaxID=1447259 RepID=A0A837J359_9BACT|nr:ABC transporter substrate-binding protein [Aliarcobacter butzleri]KLD99768.1 sensor histidine kinase [Aliarcobacter butzleri L351]KLE11930.1 sensor histidine kinase [Aliarcobacter butzleri L350]MDN5048102.1 ABC transporter substrate-binding protein [Aliarcobacter butzleri]MDN5059880.1 ABC transporter substrate-binding protein [Aliarcobacter butzleri]
MKKIYLFLLLISFLYSNELTPISVQLKWKHQFQFAGFYVAKELGIYKKYGLDVNFKEFDGKTNPLDTILDNENNFGIDDSSLIYQKLNGADVVAVFSIFKSSPIALFSQKELDTLTSLKNKNIEFSTNDISNISINAILKSQDIHVNTKEHSFYSKDFIDKKSDAIIEYLSNQTYLFDKENIKYNVFLPKDYGFDFYGDMIYTSSEFAKQNPKIVKDFIEATKEGWIYAFNNIPFTVDLIYEKYNSQKKSKEELDYEANSLKSFSSYLEKDFGSFDKSKIKEIANTISLIYPQKFKNINLDNFVWNEKEALTDFYKNNYLKENKEFTVCTQDSSFPIDGIDNNNQLIGISGEILNSIAQKFGFTLKPIKNDNYKENIQNVVDDRCDIVTIVAEDSYNYYKTMDRSNFYLKSNLAIITKINKPFIENNILENKDFVTRYSVFKDYLNSNYLGTNVSVENDLNKIIYMLKNDEVDGFITDNITVDRLIQRFGYGEFKISGLLNHIEPIKGAFAIKKTKPELKEIINLGLKDFSQEDIKLIEEKYKVTRYTEIVNEHLIWEIFYIFLFILSIILFFVIFLKVKNDELNEWLDSAIEGISLFEKGKLLKVNKQFLEILGYQNFKEVENKTYFDFVPQEDYHILKEKLKDDQEPYEIRFLKKDGSFIDGLVKGHNIKGSNKRISTIIDISELKNTQRKLAELNLHLEERIKEELQKNHEQRAIMFQQAKLAEMGSMMNMIAHQWRQPLNNISLIVNTIIIKQKKDNLTAETLDNLKMNFKQQIDYLSNTIDDFQNFFKPKKDKEPFSLKEAILSTYNLIEPIFESNQIKFNLNSNKPIDYYGYKSELYQVILTIFNNSVDAFKENDFSNKTVDVILEENKDNLIIKIKDNAGGVKEEILGKIFDLYFSTKTKKNGTGLGLYISKTIINRHFKGEIKASNVDNGLEITISLPKTNI